ncbi:hypothetical protein Pan44_31460 [Caulifigura coniformis]|uniref:Nickel uptake substrate-specific transmembrane region n=1 Tax=Caulifigura coniformis TaxID=2527983 RepID=A0A517SG51_9PLAN|nr:carboxypeptidase-like regulatory domain-containing protein [Caulifigura coniformis]QDT55104.1 hypothetical protein Pan44_31460 [Caulifigura coniformis]
MATQFFFWRACRRPAGLLLFLCVAGCSSSDPDAKLNRPSRVPVSGVVTFKGRPIADADVTFMNETANTTGTGRTDSEGQFALTTFRDLDGAVPGDQKVAIRRVDVVNKTPEDVDVSAGGVAVPPEIHWIVPEKYSDLRKSGLTASVTEAGPNHFEFALK